MEQPIIQLENVKKYFPVGGKHIKKAYTGYLHAVDDVSFQIKKGEIFGVVGESGSGKSTVGRCIVNLHETTGGLIYYKGTKINNLKNAELKPYRKDIQMIFQNPFASFNPKKSIESLFIELGKVHGMPPGKARARAESLLDRVSLPREVLQRRSNELSGGQLQRLAIARALMLAPEFIVADEPVSALDMSVQAQILNLFTQLRDELGLTIMFISHDLTVVESICDTVAVIYLGVIVELSPARELFSKIMHPYSEALISAKPREHPLERTDRIILKGDIPSAIDVPEGCRFSDRCPRFRDELCKCVTPKLREIESGHYVACHYPIRDYPAVRGGAAG